MSIYRFKGAIAAAVIVIAAGCGGGATSTVPFTTVNPTSPSYDSLQFAVGTANLYGTATGLNVVSTFRQSSGESATGVNTPTITGPFAVRAAAAPGLGLSDPYTTVFNAAGGPSVREAGSGSIGGTPQTVAPGTPVCDGPGPFPAPPPGNTGVFVTCPSGLAPNTSTFGQSGGVFAMGIAPYNAVAATGQAYGYQPYPQPFYSVQDPTSQYQFIPWGGPPAFDPDGTGMGERDGIAISGADSFGDQYFLGVGEGITAFDNVNVTSGTYTLNVAVSTLGNGSAVSTNNVSKTAKLNASVVLGNISAPSFTPDAKGGGSITVALPAGVTEAYAQIVDYGPGRGPLDTTNTPSSSNCQGPRGIAQAPVYYTIHMTTSGTYALPDTIGPNQATTGGKSNLQPSPSICTATQNVAAVGAGTPGDDIVVQLIGFDYPVYSAALGLTQASTPENPPITGSSGQADITISQAMEQDNGLAAQSPLVHVRRSSAQRVTPRLTRRIR